MIVDDIGFEYQGGITRLISPVILERCFEIGRFSDAPSRKNVVRTAPGRMIIHSPKYFLQSATRTFQIATRYL